MPLLRDRPAAARRRFRYTLGTIVLAALAFATRADAQGKAPAAPTDGFWRASDGVRIHYTVSGDSAARSVVLVHGFIADARSWTFTLLPERLRMAGYRVVAVDLRGNGASDKPTKLASYSKDAEARDVMGLARALHLGDYCVVGYSRGSIITARLLVLDRRVRCAVLGGMGADFTNPEWPRRVAAYRLLAGLPQDSAAAAPVAGMLVAVEQRGLDRKVLALMQQAQPSTSRAELGRVRQPVLVIAGDQDRDNGDAVELARLMPHATSVTVPGNHGSVIGSAPFADHVVEFIGRVAKGKR